MIPLDLLPLCAIIVDSNFLITKVNDHFTKTFGWLPEEVLGKSVNMLLPEGSREAHTKHMMEYMKNPVQKPLGEGRTMYAASKDGSLFPVEVSLVPYQDRTVVLACVVDISLSTMKQISDQIRIITTKGAEICQPPQ